MAPEFQDWGKGEEGVHFVRVGQDTRLNNRVIHLRTPANQAIFRIQCQVSALFRQALLDEEFGEFHTPKLIAGASEGGSSVFKLDYKGQPACNFTSLDFEMEINEHYFEVLDVLEKSFMPFLTA